MKDQELLEEAAVPTESVTEHKSKENYPRYTNLGDKVSRSQHQMLIQPHEP